jgi:succinyl-diaminopimelate desuccinylase
MNIPRPEYPNPQFERKNWVNLNGEWEFEIDHCQPPHHVDKDSLLVKTLLEVYKTYTGKDEAPLSMGGGTYARTLPNKAVAFGIQFPGTPDRAHQANEGVNIEDLKISAKMFACALEKLVF